MVAPIRRLLLFVCISFCLWSGLADATTYHVAKGGSGSACTAAAPCLTIATGISKLVGGDTLTIHAGTYNEIIDNTPPSGSPGAPTTIQANPGETVILQVSGPNKILHLFGKSYITFDHLILDGTAPANTVYGTFYEGTSTNITFQSGIVRNTEQCVLVGDGSNHNLFQNNVIVNCGQSAQLDHCVYDGESFNTYLNNDLSGCDGFGFHFFNQDHPANLHDNTAIGNYVHGAAHLGGILVGGARMTIYNNVVANTGSAGINVQYTGPTNSKVYENTVYNSCNLFHGLYVEGTGHDVRNNLVYCPAGGDSVNNNCTSGCTLSNNLQDQDPFFRAAAGGDFHISSAASPAINFGATLPAPYNVDRESLARPSGQFTAGAYQFAAAGPPSFTFTASTPVSSGTSSTLTWSAVGHSGTGLLCTASVPAGGPDTAWSNLSSATLIAGGQIQSSTISANRTYRLSCSDSLGTTTVDQSVTVVAPCARTVFDNSGAPWPVPGTIEAENFDTCSNLGTGITGQNVTHSDLNTLNIDGAYRVFEDVDMATVAGASNGTAVTWVGATEWLEYSITVGASGNYTITTSVAFGDVGSGGTFHYSLDGVPLGATQTVPNTGSWTVFNTVSTTGAITAGAHILRLSFDSNSANGFVGDFDKIVIASVAGGPIANFTGTPLSGAAPLNVSFTDSSTGSITSRSWTFGDGGTSTLQNPSHSYATPGTYTVAETVNGPGGSNTLTRPSYITVTTAGARTYYVATNGSDSNNGLSTGAPFLTVQKACSIAVAGDTVFIRAGTYRETCTPTNSGVSGSPITISPYQNELVTISGADLVSGWVVDAGNVYRTALAWDLGRGNNQVFVDGSMMMEARWPNTSLANILTPSLSHASSINTTTTSAPFTVHDAAIPAGSWVGATVTLVGRWAFTPGFTFATETGVVTSSSAGQVTANFDYPYDRLPPNGVAVDWYMTGIRNALDIAGEWVVTGGNVYLWSPDSLNPSTHVVEVKRRTNAFNLAGKSYITIQNLRFFAATITTDASSSHVILDGLNGTYLSHFTSMDLTSTPGGGTGDPGNTHAVDSGIILAGTNHTLKNSTLTYSAGALVNLVGGSGQTLFNNLLSNCTYTAWDLGCITTGLKPEDGGSSTLNNQVTFNSIWNASGEGVIFHSSIGGQFANNEVYNVMLMNMDHGAFYASSTPATNGLRISYNVIHDIPPLAGRNGGVDLPMACIYLDNNEGGVIVDHNVCYNADHGFTGGYGAGRPDPNINRYYNNTVQARTATISLNLANASLYQFRNNIFNVGFIWANQPADVQTSILSGTNPLFINAAGFNYQIQAASPARNAGVVLAPYTNGFCETFPDIGAYEFACPVWTYGAFPVQTVVIPTVKLTFEEGMGTVAHDTSGNTVVHDCTLNTAGWAPGIVGNYALDANGARECHIAGTADLRTTAALGLFLFESATIPNTGYFMDFGGAWGLWNDSTGGVHCYINTSNGNVSVVTTGINVLDGSNTDIGCTKDAQGLRLWVKGAQVAFTPTTANIVYNGTETLYVGRNGQSAQEYFTGRLDAVQVFNTALTQANIDQLRNNALPTIGMSVTHEAYTMANLAQGTILGGVDMDLSLPTTTPIGIRWAIHNNTGASITEYFRPFCRIFTNQWGPWTEVGNSFGSLGVRFYTDSAVNIGDATTTILPLDGFTATGGKFLADTVDLTSPYDAAQQTTIGNGQQSEEEARLEFGAPLIAGNLVQCRPYREVGTPMDDYGGACATAVRTITLQTIVAPPSGLHVGGSLQGGSR